MGRRQRSRTDLDPLLPTRYYWDRYRTFAKALYANGVDHAFRPLTCGAWKDLDELDDAMSRGIYTAAVLNERIFYMATALQTALKLPAPFPNALGKHNVSNYGFYCDNTNTGSFCFHNFHSAYAARHFLDVLIDGHEYRWLSSNKIAVANGIIIRGEGKENVADILDYEMTAREREWIIPEPYHSYFNQFAGKIVRRVRAEGDAPVARVARVKRDRPASTKRVAPDGFVSIGDIADELKIEPRICRAILRSNKIEKPEHGWQWASDKASTIRELIRAKSK